MILDGAVSFDTDGHLTDGRLRRVGLPEHWERFPSGTQIPDSELLDAIRAVDLTGRGGAHFPVARKLEALAETGAGTVVVNGAETEVLSSKDAMLLQLHPHLVLDGAQALARQVKAAEVVIWLHEGALASYSSMQVAVYERERDPRHAGESAVRIAFGPRRYPSGEASAVAAGVRGLPALPAFIEWPGRVWTDGSPVLVHNVETHARVALLVRRGAEAYSPASLVTIALPRHRIVVEAKRNTTFAAMFAHERITPPEHVLLGGYSGTWLPWDRIASIVVDPASVRRHGVAFGSGVVAMPPHGREALDWSAEILRWMAGESSGQCGPCTYGLPELARLFTEFAAARKRTPKQREQLEDVLTLVSGRGACRHPDGVVRMARSAIEVLAPGVDA